MYSRRVFGFSMIELIAVLAVMLIGSAVMYGLHTASVAKAAVQDEQKNIGEISTALQSLYATRSSFSGISAADLRDVPLGSVTWQGGEIAGAFKRPITIRAATVVEPNDSFDLVYSGLERGVCGALAVSATPSTYAILVGTTNVQDRGQRVTSEADLLSLCSTGAPLTLRFHPEKNTGDTTLVAACVCAPSNEEQAFACATGQSGSIIQKRSSACTGGTPTCRTAEWSSWTTTSNTCVSDPTVPVPPVIVPPTTPSCIPTNVTRAAACPSGQMGAVLERRTLSCPSNTWGPWATVSSTCQAVVAPSTNCTPSTQTQMVACPEGQGGQVTQTRSSSCPTSTGSPVWGGWVTTGSTCTSACLAGGNCCTVGTEKRTGSQQCPAGTWGSQTADEQRNSTCASSTSTPVWGGWTTTNTTGTCSTCPANTTENADRWVGMSAACPSGQVGSHTWEGRQVQQRSVTYNCPAGTTAPPSAQYGSWAAWSATGETRSDVNTCTVPPPAVVCDYKTRTDINPAGEYINPANPWTSLRTCGASNLGQKAYANYTSCGGAGCGGTYRGLECTTGGWKVIAGAGSSPYNGWSLSNPTPTDYVTLLNQGHLDWQQQSIDAGRTTGAVDRSWTIYQCM